MTTPTTTPPLPLTRTLSDGTTQTALSERDMRSLLTKLNNGATSKGMYVKARGGDGTNMVGLYLELVCTLPGKESHSRYFVVGQHVWLSHREKGMSKATWRHKAGSSLESALVFIDNTMQREGVELYGRVLLVELEADSVSQIETGQLPGARFRGQHRIERDYGKYDFGMDIKFDGIPASVVSLLQAH